MAGAVQEAPRVALDCRRALALVEDEQQGDLKVRAAVVDTGHEDGDAGKDPDQLRRHPWRDVADLRAVLAKYADGVLMLRMVRLGFEDDRLSDQALRDDRLAVAAVAVGIGYARD